MRHSKWRSLTYITIIIDPFWELFFSQGFKVQYNLANPNGKRVVRLQVRKCYGCQEFDDVVGTNKYEVAMPEFLADGGDGYEMFKKSKIRNYGTFGFRNVYRIDYDLLVAITCLYILI